MDPVGGENGGDVAVEGKKHGRDALEEEEVEELSADEVGGHDEGRRGGYGQALADETIGRADGSASVAGAGHGDEPDGRVE